MMMRTCAVLAAVAACASALAPLHINDSPVEGKYIVVFNKDSTEAQRAAHMSKVKTLGTTDKSFNIERTFDFMTFHGYSGSMSEATVNAIRTDDGVVQFVETDGVVTIAAPIDTKNVRLNLHRLNETNKADTCVAQLEATWGIVRSQQRNRNIDGIFEYDNMKSGQGVDAYIIDTGIYTDHVEFEGRATFGEDTTGTRPPNTGDGNGHGTHVAGTVMSKSFGIAKKANAIGVKVLTDGGSGSTAGVVAGVEWTCKDHTAKKNKCVANMSLGGGRSVAMNQAVEAAVACGCQFAIASGNSRADACSYSPASAEGVITVNSMDNTDGQSSFSNHGRCTDIYAPGSSITSTWIGSPYAENTISGTSMAAPHVCGGMAVHAMENDDPADLKAAIIGSATDDKIERASPSTPNKLLYINECQK